MRRNNYSHWIKLQRRYRKIQEKLVSTRDARLERKADIIGRRLFSLNRKWQLGIATSVLTAWLAMMPVAPVHAQTFLPSPIELSALDGTDGFAITNSYNGYHYTSISISNAGDVNGDGIDDLIVGAYYGNSSDGAAYVVFGSISSFGATIDLALLDGTDGFKINGESGYYVGQSVSAAGDVNGDGFDDVVIGTYRYSDGAYIVFGKNTGFTASIDVSSLDETNGFKMTSGGYSGNTVSGAGDVNGDGIDDLIIGTYYADPGGIGEYEGTSYVLFGKNTAFAATIDLSTLDGTTGFRMDGEAYSYAGIASGAGDINGDGFDDVIMGAPNADRSNRAGAAYVVFGSNAGFNATIQASNLDGSNGFIINGSNNMRLGNAVSIAGDVNNDGIDDLIIGAQRDNNVNGAGSSYVVFGTTSGFSASLNASDLDGSNGFVINGANSSDYSGISVSNAGDVDGDGVADLIIGAYGTDPNGNYSAGSSYIVFGNSDGFNSPFELADITAANGSVINGANNNDYSGISVSAAGDINGDGLDDFLIGAYRADPIASGYDGAAYVVFGVQRPTVPTIASPIPDQLTVEDNAFSFTIPDNILINTGKVHTASAILVGGAALPEWLSLDGITHTFTGTAGKADIATISIEVTFTDTDALFTSGTFDLEVLKGQEFQAVIELSEFDGSTGFVINGVAYSDYSGKSVSAAGDINGDGIDDFIIGAHKTDPNGNSYSGSSYVVFGSTTSLGSSLELSSLDGSNGFVINGIAAFDFLGSNVSDAGDVNADGIDDLLISAQSADPNSNNSSGSSYVVFGSTSAFSAALELSSLDGTNGFAINGVAFYDLSGISLSNAGDINGDGVDDIIIGAHYADPNSNDRSGSSYVVFGSANAFGSTIELSSLDGSNGFIINGVSAYDYAGISVSNAGDVNGDGIDDLIIGADGSNPNGSDSGATYVVFGSTSLFGAALELSSLDGTNGFTINGVYNGDEAGRSVSAAGDVNGDGVDDVIIGARSADPNSNNYSGASYVVFGSSSPFSASMELSALDGTNGFAINGVAAYDFSGYSVSSAGDINGDGVDDLVIGAYEADSNGDDSGASYVVFGSTSAFGATLELSSLDGSNGFIINGASNDDNSGNSVSGTGDINGDGIDDLVIGANNASPNGSYSGASYIVFGIAIPTAPTLANAIADQPINEDDAFNFMVPANTFDDINPGDTETLSATLSGEAHCHPG